LAVDVRKILASHTMRNFSVEIALGLVPSQMGLSFEEKCQEIDRQLKERTQKEYIQNMVSEYVEGMKNPVVKRIPLIIKDRLIDYLYAKTSIERACTCISNLGNFALPEDMSPYIDNVYFGMGARTIEEPALEEEFFRRMQEMGMKISMREWQ